MYEIANGEIRKKKLVCIFSLTIYFIIMFFLCNSFSSLNLNGLIGWGLLFSCMATWKYLSTSLISPYTFFLILLFLFTFGQSLLYPLGLLTIERNLLSYSYISFTTLIAMQKYTLYCLFFFHVGGILFFRYVPKFNKSFKVISDELINKAGVLLFSLSVVPFLYRSYVYITIFRSQGYNALYDTSGVISGVILNLSNLFFVSLFFLLVANRQKNLRRNILYFVTCVSLVPFFMSGKRIDAMSMILTLILFQNFFVKKIEFKNAVKYLIPGILIIILIGTLSIFRVQEDVTFAQYFNYVVSEGYKKNFFVDIMAELGFSMAPAVVVKDLVDSGLPIRYGGTLLFSMLSVVPSFGLWNTAYIDSQISLANWLTSYLGLSYGTGFSIVAEAYLNFQNGGVLFFLVLGMLLSRLFSKLNANIVESSPFSGLLVLIFFRFIATIPRDSFLGIVRTGAYIILPSLIVVYGLKLFSRKKAK